MGQQHAAVRPLYNSASWTFASIFRLRCRFLLGMCLGYDMWLVIIERYLREHFVWKRKREDGAEGREEEKYKIESDLILKTT